MRPPQARSGNQAISSGLSAGAGLAGEPSQASAKASREPLGAAAVGPRLLGGVGDEAGNGSGERRHRAAQA